MYFRVRLEDGGRAPSRQPDSAGYDCYPAVDGVIDPLGRLLVPLGFSAEFDPRYVGLLLDRSGVGLKGVTRFGGVIDASYRGQWKAVLWNSTPTPFSFVANEKPIIQCVFVPIGVCDVTLVEELSSSLRGEGGFGSTDAQMGKEKR